MERYYAPLNYAVIDALWVESVKGKATIKADLVTAAGDKLEDVEITSITANENFFDHAATGDDTEFKAEDLIGLGTGTANVVFANDSTLGCLYDTLFAYTTEDGAYKLSLNGKGIWDVTNYNSVTSKNAVKFTNGSSYAKATAATSDPVEGTVLFQMTSETLVLVQDADTEAPYATYTSYTGYDNVPSMTGNVQYHVNEDTNKVDVVYVNNISVSGTETVIFFAGADRFAGKKVDGEYPIEFEAYALNEDAGTLTKATYTFKSEQKDALQNMAVGFYKVYVSDDNEISLVANSAATSITGSDLITAGNTVAQGVSATQKDDVTGNYIEAGSVKIDGGDADIVTYVLDDDALKDGKFEDLANGDKLYVYKSDDKFTIVNAATLAEIKVVKASGGTVLGVTTSADQTIGHTYEGMVISGIPEGMEVTSVAFDSEHSYTSAVNWEADQTDVVEGDITITLDWSASYKVATLNTPVYALGTVSSSEITVYSELNYTVSELLAVLKAGLTQDVATVAVKFGADFVDADSSLRFTNANKGGWTVVVTSGSGETVQPYTFK